MSHLLFSLMVAITCGSLSAQSVLPSRGEFDAVSIQPSLATEPSGFTAQAGGVTIRNTTLRRIITMVYEVDDRQLAGGPLWIDDDPFDIVATAGPKVSRDQLMGMTRALLADRFKLALRSEVRELPVYELTTVRSDKRLGSGLRRSARTCRGGRSAERPGCATRVAPGSIVSTGTTMPAFVAKHLAPLLDRLILDRTGLEGTFDVELHFRTPSRVAPQTTPSSSSAGLLAAVETQLGLRLRATSGSVAVLVVDRVERPSND